MGSFDDGDVGVYFGAGRLLVVVCCLFGPRNVLFRWLVGWLVVGLLLPVIGCCCCCLLLLLLFLLLLLLLLLFLLLWLLLLFLLGVCSLFFLVNELNLCFVIYSKYDNNRPPGASDCYHIP